MTSRTPREIITDTVLNMPAGLPAADQVERIVEELRLENYHFAKVTVQPLDQPRFAVIHTAEGAQP